MDTLDLKDYNFVFSSEKVEPIKEDTEELKEYRCYQDGNLLCKAKGEWHIEIQNPKNRVMNYIWPSRKNQYTWPMWQQFTKFCTN